MSRRLWLVRLVVLLGRFVGGESSDESSETSASPTPDSNPKDGLGGLEVIGAGFARTGTTSMEAALKKLGHKTYETGAMMRHQHTDGWIEAAQALVKGNLEPLESMVQRIETLGYTATLDLPMNMFALGLAEIRPNAKVLLTVRDSPEKWFESFHAVAHLVDAVYCRPWSWLIGDFGFLREIVTIIGGVDLSADVIERRRILPWYEVVVSDRYRDTDEGRRKWINLYESFQEEVERSVTPERRITYNVQQGWEPLLCFLEVDDPELASSEFPYRFDRKAMETGRKIVDVIAVGLPVWLVLPWFLLFVAIRRCSSLKPSEKNKKA